MSEPLLCKKEENAKNCTCSKTSCVRRGLCCECIARHRAKRQVPGCFFPKDEEQQLDRSFEHFAQLVLEKKV